MAVDTQIQSLRYDKEALAPSKNLFSLRECNIVFPPLTYVPKQNKTTQHNTTLIYLCSKMDVQIVSSSGSSSVPTSDTESKPVFELVQSSLGQLTLSGSGAVPLISFFLFFIFPPPPLLFFSFLTLCR